MEWKTKDPKHKFYAGKICSPQSPKRVRTGLEVGVKVNIQIRLEYLIEVALQQVIYRVSRANAAITLPDQVIPLNSETYNRSCLDIKEYLTKVL